MASLGSALWDGGVQCGAQHRSHSASAAAPLSCTCVQYVPLYTSPSSCHRQPPSPRLAPQGECLTLGTGLNLQAQPCLRASCPASLSTLSRGCEGHQHDRLSRCQASDWGHCCPVHSALKTVGQLLLLSHTPCCPTLAMDLGGAQSL